MRSNRSLALVALLASLAGGLGRPLLAQHAIPVHQIGPIVGRIADSIVNLSSIRPLSDGRVLVNDVQGRRLLLCDAMLTRCPVIADTTVLTQHAYGSGLVGMIPFTADSTLIQDQASSAFIVVDPAGALARIIPAPRAASNPPGMSSAPPVGLGAGDHLVYHLMGFGRGSAPPAGFTGDTSVLGADSSLIRRVSLATWRPDTVAKLALPRNRTFFSRSAGGGNTSDVASNPIQAADDFAVLADGTIAVVRVSDYHIDWFGADGHVTSGPRIPTDAARLTDSAKIAIIDSLRARDSATDARVAAAAVARGDAPPTRPRRQYVRPADLPDVQPFITGFTRADAEGNVWIMVSRATPSGDGAVFDVINRQGERADRVQFPGGGTLVGFGPGVVYMSVRGLPQPGRATMWLVKARIHGPS